jgi:hypothetical protein
VNPRLRGLTARLPDLRIGQASGAWFVTSMRGSEWQGAPNSDRPPLQSVIAVTAAIRPPTETYKMPRLEWITSAPQNLSSEARRGRFPRRGNPTRGNRDGHGSEDDSPERNRAFH